MKLKNELEISLDGAIYHLKDLSKTLVPGYSLSDRICLTRIECPEIRLVDRENFRIYLAGNRNHNVYDLTSLEVSRLNKFLKLIKTNSNFTVSTTIPETNKINIKIYENID